MLGEVLSVLLMGVIPVWGGGSAVPPAFPLTVEPPFAAGMQLLTSIQGGDALSASGVVITDLRSGQTLYARDGQVRRPMASLTKLMTALLIAEQHGLDEWVKVPSDIGSVEGTVAKLPPGHQFTVGDLLKAVLVGSANDAAVTLARFHSGNEEAFVVEMNERAKVLGLHNTSFANPVGFDADQQWSTPQDIAWLSTFVLRREELRSRLSLHQATIRSKTGTSVAVEQTHQLLRDASSSVVAGKTGTTVAAAECLVSVVQEGDREILVVLLGSRHRYGDMHTLLSILKSLFA